MTKNKTILILMGGLLLATGTGCTGKTDHTYPMDQRDARRERRGHLIAEEGQKGINLFGGDKESAGTGSGGIGVNSFLWRASLDTFSFMPLASADPFGGVIITDWYEDPETPGERFKANVVILDKSLRADGVKVRIFKQRKDERGDWRDMAVADTLPKQLEDSILTRARELRIKQGK